MIMAAVATEVGLIHGIMMLFMQTLKYPSARIVISCEIESSII